MKIQKNYLSNSMILLTDNFFYLYVIHNPFYAFFLSHKWGCFYVIISELTRDYLKKSLLHENNFHPMKTIFQWKMNLINFQVSFLRTAIVIVFFMRWRFIFILVMSRCNQALSQGLGHSGYSGPEIILVKSKKQLNKDNLLNFH